MKPPTPPDVREFDVDTRFQKMARRPGGLPREQALHNAANNIEEIKAKTEALTEEFHTISAKMYQQAQQAQEGAGGFDPNMGNMGGGAQEDSQPRPDNVVDADYEVVDEENK